MNDLYQLKHGDLFLEFTRYITTHPKFSDNIPEGAEVVLLDCHDAGYTRFMLRSAPKDSKNIVFIDVGELAPIRSRVLKPKVISRDIAKSAVKQQKMKT